MLVNTAPGMSLAVKTIALERENKCIPCCTTKPSFTLAHCHIAPVMFFGILLFIIFTNLKPK